MVDYSPSNDNEFFIFEVMTMGSEDEPRYNVEIIVCYIQKKSNVQCLCMLTFNFLSRCFFVNDSVVSDGNFYTITPFDPLFFLIPVMSKVGLLGIFWNCL